MNFSEILKDIRLSAKLTQEQFANSINVNRGTISQIEGGRANPTIEMLEKIINIYGIDANTFFKKDIPNFIPNNIPNDININNSSLLISENDLSILNTIVYFPSIKDLEKYSYLGDKEIKLLQKNLFYTIEDKISTSNSINKLAKMLGIKRNVNKFIDLDAKTFINKSLEEYNPNDWDSQLNFEDEKIYDLVKIYALNEALEHIYFIIDNQISTLLKECSYSIKFGDISINKTKNDI